MMMMMLLMIMITMTMSMDYLHIGDVDDCDYYDDEYGLLTHR